MVENQRTITITTLDSYLLDSDFDSDTMITKNILE